MPWAFSQAALPNKVVTDILTGNKVLQIFRDCMPEVIKPSLGQFVLCTCINIEPKHQLLLSAFKIYSTMQIINKTVLFNQLVFLMAEKFLSLCHLPHLQGQRAGLEMRNEQDNTREGGPSGSPVPSSLKHQHTECTQLRITD